MTCSDYGVTVWDVRDLVKAAQCVSRRVDIDGIEYAVPARPLGFTGIFHRAKAAWVVFTGWGDVVIWPNQMGSCPEPIAAPTKRAQAMGKF